MGKKGFEQATLIDTQNYFGLISVVQTSCMSHMRWQDKMTMTRRNIYAHVVNICQTDNVLPFLPHWQFSPHWTAAFTRQWDHNIWTQCSAEGSIKRKVMRTWEWFKYNICFRWFVHKRSISPIFLSFLWACSAQTSNITVDLKCKYWSG